MVENRPCGAFLTRPPEIIIAVVIDPGFGSRSGALFFSAGANGSLTKNKLINQNKRLPSWDDCSTKHDLGPAAW